MDKLKEQINKINKEVYDKEVFKDEEEVKEKEQLTKEEKENLCPQKN